MGNADEDIAAGRMTALLTHFRQHPVTGITERGPSSVGPQSPLNLRIVDHITASVREVADQVREVTPDAGPPPSRVEAVYAWYIENTRQAPEDVQRRRDTVVYRQSLEHAIAMGDTKVVRPHRCPACRTLGLMWESRLQLAVCTNGRCLTKTGLSRRWTLARLAYEHVAGMYEKGVRDCAT